MISLKELADKTVGDTNPIFESQRVSILTLYRTAEQEVQALENEIIPLIQELNPKTLTIPEIGYITIATIVAEYGDFSRFSSPAQMLSFAGLEPISVRNYGVSWEDGETWFLSASLCVNELCNPID